MQRDARWLGENWVRGNECCQHSKEREWALAWIDEKGHYVIGSGWSREGSSSKTRFRICVIPDTHKAKAKAPQGPRARAWGG